MEGLSPAIVEAQGSYDRRFPAIAASGPDFRQGLSSDRRVVSHHFGYRERKSVLVAPERPFFQLLLSSGFSAPTALR